jgi:hypothetical protein
MCFDVLAHKRFLVQGETVGFEFDTHAEKLADNAKVFDFERLEAGKQIFDQLGACRGGQQIIHVYANDDYIAFFAPKV